ncbi:MAG TPA: hypothetical protein VF177_23805 [Anaerolineae bacterium]
MLTEAQQRAGRRHFIAAANAQTAARNLATEAYAAASEQVQKINQLQRELEEASQRAITDADEALVQAERLLPQIRTEGTSDAVRELSARLSEAKQARSATISLEDHALAAGLASAIAAFVAAGELAKQAQAHIAGDRDSYNQLRDEAQAQIRRAQIAMSDAERKVNHVDAAYAGQQALLRARDVLPAEQAIINATREALAQVKQAATQAYEYAREAERKAEEAIRYAEQRRRQWAIFIPPSSPGWPGRPRSGGWSFPSGRPTSRPSGRSSSGSASRRTGSAGLSRRSSSSGSFRRSTASGASRRSSSGGSRRRR